MKSEVPTFTLDGARQMLAWGAEPDVSPFSHRQIAEWCDRFWCSYIDLEPPSGLERALPVMADVDVQWDLFLANSFSFEELRRMDMDQVRLPVEWFTEWAAQLEA